MATTTSLNSNEIYAAVDSARANGTRITVKHLALRFNCTIAFMRKALMNHYGSQIKFTKGRTGGIQLMR